MSFTVKRWLLQPHDPAAIEALARDLNSSPIVAQLLLNRQLSAPDEAKRFLQAPLSGLHDPERLPGVPQAVERLLAAVQADKRICVYGDYDVDGVTGTAILWHLLTLMGAKVEFHVPHRVDDGYGLNSDTLRRLAEAGTQTIVTVDCGIASITEAEEARRLNLELIITDHHEMKDRLPDADVLVHPRLPGTDYPFGGLSGSGVALKLAWAMARSACGSNKVNDRYKAYLLDAVALAALGTVADVVPLQDENRILVRGGLNQLRKSKCVGFHALLQVAGLGDKQSLVAMDIGFSLAPRLNAAGRLGSARLAVELLTTTSETRAKELAQILEKTNQERQQAERKISFEARNLAEQFDPANVPALVLARQKWHPGLIGIVAGRLAESFHRPVLMIALDENGGPAAGSGRSVPGFKLHEALQACTTLLVSHGGHAAAAGFKVLAENVVGLREQFCAFAGTHFGTEPAPPCLEIDAEVPLAALTTNLVDAMGQLEPYGAGNPQPLFLAGDLQVVGEPKKVGAGERHLSFKVRQGTRDQRCIAFGMADRLDELMSAGGKCALAFTPKINEWQGRRSVDLQVCDWQAGPTARLG